MGLADVVLEATWCLCRLHVRHSVSFSISPTVSSLIWTLTRGTSACFAAGFRLAVTVSYSLSQDVTYTFCTVGIWVVVELTCGLIVLCMPSLPKALTDLGVTKVYVTLKSWATASRTKAYNMQDGSTSHFGQSYKKKAEVHHWQAFDSSSTALGNESGYLDPKNLEMELGQRPIPRDTTILRTTQIGIVTQETGQYPSGEIEAQSQRPWDIESGEGQRMRPRWCLWSRWFMTRRPMGRKSRAHQSKLGFQSSEKSQAMRARTGNSVWLSLCSLVNRYLSWNPFLWHEEEQEGKRRVPHPAPRQFQVRQLHGAVLVPATCSCQPVVLHRLTAPASEVWANCYWPLPIAPTRVKEARRPSTFRASLVIVELIPCVVSASRGAR